tara:strand:- start:287 stop:589 length:303 start_codon:yes stop_codon:yes gene_type:complete
MKIKKGDTIKVITGADKGKEGRVIKIYSNTDKVLVEGIKLVKKHVRPNQENPQGGILEKEMPIHVSNVALVVNGNPSKVGFRKLDDGKKVRYSKKTNEVI